MEIIWVSLKRIKRYANNPRHNADAVDGVMESVRQFGFKVPIVLDADRVIVCGDTRYLAAKRLGMDKVPCILADDLTPEQIRAFRVADNKVAEIAEWDYDRLRDELKALRSIIDMEPFGFPVVEDTEITVVDVDLSSFFVAADDAPPRNPKAMKCPHCGGIVEI